MTNSHVDFVFIDSLDSENKRTQHIKVQISEISRFLR